LILQNKLNGFLEIWEHEVVGSSPITPTMLKNVK